ncbi:uncharacterized protein LOC128987575 [Macrosteles quadrilineatus]|uniref:uncharacterized protein LOC128987575 n=1 Tax=Macrosteles quadrilineatus TaxID=74068 RepID=UPI0023E27026|nr:uncharacterized protein LOC128987575 [Macrosteles quadrilineatus]
MDETAVSSGKKQRGKNQRDRRKRQEEPSESVSSVDTAGSVTDPQPQRSNRRQRNEVVAPPTNNVVTVAPFTGTDAKVPAEKENVTIDFSNLKRETEEIAKLTKKFAKRNISSNWHRYSAPQGPEDDSKEDVEAPADFSALIQVPSSKGGHLQLKDEREWSSASNEQLGGYFALNMKQLSHSLQCIPLYEQLRLPKHMFTEDELKHFDNIASQARKTFNPDAVEDPNDLVSRTLSNLIIDGEKPESQITVNNDIQTSNTKENCLKSTNIFLQSDLLPETTLTDNQDSFKSQRVVNNDMAALNIVKEEKLKIDVSNEFSSSCKFTENETTEKSNLPDKFQDDIQQTCKNNILSDVIAEVSSSKNDIISIKETKENNPQSITIDQPKEKRTKSKREPCKDDAENKTINVKNTLKIEDDDELDFLLSIKKPGIPENKKPVSNVGPTLKPGSEALSQGSSDQQHSELDDWLDSVLQD